jgi:hypothetical protein
MLSLRITHPSSLRLHHSPKPHPPSYQSLKSKKQFSSNKPSFQAASKKPNQPEELPNFSFNELGATKTVKFVMIAGLSVIGTMETIFYAKILMRKMGWDEDEGKGEKE